MVSTHTTSTTKKTTMGRRKIEMKKIERPNHLQVTFSKRRAGLFKKASDLCLLTGAQVAVIVTSPANRLFSFGHHSVDSILDRYLTGTKISIDEFNPEEYCEKIEAEGGRGGFWWDERYVENLGVEELGKYLKALEELKSNVLNRADELKMMSMIESFCDGDDHDHYRDTVSFGLSEAVNQFGSGYLEDVVNFDGAHI
ncbi:hypothetical protein LguiB_022022 [Lonicera macranthoides]